MSTSPRDNRRAPGRGELRSRLREAGFPPSEALGLGASSPWRLVAEAARDVRVAPAVRVALDRGLATRAGTLSIGEAVALARIAPEQTRRALFERGECSVRRALTENARATPRERSRWTREIMDDEEPR